MHWLQSGQKSIFCSRLFYITQSFSLCLISCLWWKAWKKKKPFRLSGFLGGWLRRLPKKLWFSPATVLLLDMVMDGAGEVTQAIRTCRRHVRVQAGQAWLLFPVLAPAAQPLNSRVWACLDHRSLSRSPSFPHPPPLFNPGNHILRGNTDWEWNGPDVKREERLWVEPMSSVSWEFENASTDIRHKV